MMIMLKALYEWVWITYHINRVTALVYHIALYELDIRKGSLSGLPFDVYIISIMEINNKRM